jgi:hypothetical protein
MPEAWKNLSERLFMANSRPDVYLLWEKYSYNPLTGRFHSVVDDYEYRGNLVGNGGRSHQLSISSKFRAPYGVCVFAWIHGRWPKDKHEIDHIDRNPFNHKFWNLREVTKSENLKNRSGWGLHSRQADLFRARKRIQREFKAPRG